MNAKGSWVARGTVAAALAFALFPVYWIVLTALRPRGEIFSYPVRLLPGSLTLDNLRTVWFGSGTSQPVLPFLGTSLIVAGASTVLSTALGTACAYGMARHRAGGRAFAMWILSQRFLPAVALAELDGLNTPNAYGHCPLVDNNPSKPDEDYWKHVDWIVKKAEEKGLYVGLLPTWGDKVTKMWGTGPEIFNADGARAYGKWIAARYKDVPNLIWINGGDRPADKSAEIWRALAAGLREGDGGRHLITFHPPGGRTSSAWFHGDDWLSINMLQTGHARDTDSAARIDADYRREPTKPVLDGEPTYEDHPLSFNPKNGYATALDVRKYLYWNLFAGACGHTYGCHNIWQMVTEGRKPISWAHASWQESLDLPGAGQVKYAGILLESRPYVSRVPDQSLIASDPGKGGEAVRATRGQGYALVYLPAPKPVTIDLRKVGTSTVSASWFDPRTGKTSVACELRADAPKEFAPPADPGPDWVLVLDGK